MLMVPVPVRWGSLSPVATHRRNDIQLWTHNVHRGASEKREEESLHHNIQNVQDGEMATGVTVGVAEGAVGLAEARGVDDGEKTGSTTDEKVT